MQKHEWRKKEKAIYLPKTKPELVDIPEYKFVTITGEGNPNSENFSKYIGVLYAVSYAIKMTLKKREPKPEGYIDYDGKWKAIIEELGILVNQNQLLKEARDLLLPRLMMGMIDVDKIK